MKKLINATSDVEREMVEGFVASRPDIIATCGDGIVVRTHKKKSKVALVSGGGSGHEPTHLGYVGPGMLDAAVGGPVFTSPSAEAIIKAIHKVATPMGVLLVIKNYTGDVLNFQMAAEEAREEGIPCEWVVVADDVAVQDSLYTVGRRGVAGTVFVHKIAGALAERGAHLTEVKSVAEKVVANVRSMGLALEPCCVPAAGKPGFELGAQEIEMGIGIHGEPGIAREQLRPADELTDELLDHILADLDFVGHKVAVMVNGMGGTPLMELAIVNRRVHQVLTQQGISIYKTLLGNYMTSIEMRGVSVSLLRLDTQLAELLDDPSDTFAWRESAGAGVGRVASTLEGSEVGQVASTTNFAEMSGESVETVQESGGSSIAADAQNPHSAVVVEQAVRRMALSMTEHAEELTALDGPIGDSDHGLNMERGFNAVVDKLDQQGELGIEKLGAAGILKLVGDTLLAEVGGSSGPLYGIAFRSAAKVMAAVDEQELSLETLSGALEAATTSVMHLGRSQPGDKTMVDAMVPARDTLKQYADFGASLADGLLQAATAALAGAKATIPLRARRGRASYLGERSVGHQDPGATSFAYLLLSAAGR